MAPKTEAELALQRKYEELRKKKVRLRASGAHVYALTGPVAFDCESSYAQSTLSADVNSVWRILNRVVWYRCQLRQSISTEPCHLAADLLQEAKLKAKEQQEGKAEQPKKAAAAAPAAAGAQRASSAAGPLGLPAKKAAGEQASCGAHASSSKLTSGDEGHYLPQQHSAFL